jgi:hypothetical protein
MPDDKNSGHAGSAALTRIAPVVLTLLLLVKVYAVAWFSLETATALVVAAPVRAPGDVGTLPVCFHGWSNRYSSPPLLYGPVQRR